MASIAKDGKRRLRLGIAGLGVASTYIFPGAETSPVTEIYAAADLRQSALDAFAAKYNACTYKSVDELCADPNVDVVWIATPNQLHCEHTVLAAEHGKHVICTKPMALSVEECERMCRRGRAQQRQAALRANLEHEPGHPGHVRASRTPASSGGSSRSTRGSLPIGC